MPSSDPEKRRAAQARRRAARHAEKYGHGAGDQRGKHKNHARGSACHRWNDGRMVASTGYVKVRVGLSHPLADPNGYAYEHAVVWLAAGRPAPGPDEVIHHLNEVKTDNRIENLALTSREWHSRDHVAARERDANGRLLPAGDELDGVRHQAFPGGEA